MDGKKFIPPGYKEFPESVRVIGPKRLADSIEAIIGLSYLDLGSDSALDVIIRLGIVERSRKRNDFTFLHVLTETLQ
jgi:dsRNA-specific ribonuclease